MKTLLIELMNWFQQTGYRKASFDRLLGILPSATDYNQLNELVNTYDEYLRPAKLKGGYPGLALLEDAYPYRILQNEGDVVAAVEKPLLDVPTPVTGWAPPIPCPTTAGQVLTQSPCIQDAPVRTAPTVTPAAIAAEIVSEHYRNLGSALKQPDTSPTNNVTLCVLVLRNGFVMVGKSACVNAENFNEEMGKQLAREDAIRQIWPLLGFRMADQRIFPSF